ncbi:MAG: hypothetical protein H6742_18110 [Alphaproteobacteria bacterium]|nr:hypothetical protein [Alphaproteobacteria bacterium]
MSAALLLLVLACGDKGGDTGPGDTDGGDTDATDTDATDTDTDTDTTDGGVDSGDTTDTTDGGADSGDPGDLTATATLLLSGITEGQAVALVPVTVEKDGADPTFWPPVQVVEASTSVVVRVAPPDETYLRVVDDSMPDFRIALYLPARFADLDGDLEHDDDEPWTGIGGTWLAFVEPPVPGSLKPYIDPGWNAFNVDLASDTPFWPANIDAVNVPDNLVPLDTLSLGGTWGASVSPGETTRLAVVPPVIADHAVDALLYDEPVGASFSLTIDGPPPADHYGDLDGTGRLQAGEYLLVYDDTDGTTGLDVTTDTLRFSACHDDQVVVLLYADPPTDLGDGLLASVSDTPIGWSAFAEPEGAFRRLSDSERAALVLAEGCAYE